jgi:hypothetical protein
LIEKQLAVAFGQFRRYIEVCHLTAVPVALCLHFAFYNLCRIHGSLRVTPAMEAGIADHLWELRELVPEGRKLVLLLTALSSAKFW